MSFTFTNNPAADTTDAVRILLGDTSSGTAKLTDETISWLLGAHASVRHAAAEGAEIIAGDFARLGGSVAVGDLKIEYAKSAREFKALAKTLRAQGARLGTLKPVSGTGSKDFRKTQRKDSDWDRPSVEVGGMDHPYTNPALST